MASNELNGLTSEDFRPTTPKEAYDEISKRIRIGVSRELFSELGAKKRKLSQKAVDVIISEVWGIPI